eukprot:UN33557
MIQEKEVIKLLQFFHRISFFMQDPTRLMDSVHNRKSTAWINSMKEKKLQEPDLLNRRLSMNYEVTESEVITQYRGFLTDITAKKSTVELDLCFALETQMVQISTVIVNVVRDHCSYTNGKRKYLFTDEVQLLYNNIDENTGTPMACVFQCIRYCSQYLQKFKKKYAHVLETERYKDVIDSLHVLLDHSMLCLVDHLGLLSAKSSCK